MKILELENRCTGNRTVGSNPTLSPIVRERLTELQRFIDDRLLVVAEAASNTKRRRNDDCASYKDTHDKIPRCSVGNRTDWASPLTPTS